MIDLIQERLSAYKAALFQWGPWAHQKIDLTIDWLKRELIMKAARIDWPSAADDVRHLRPLEQHSLSLWNEKFFTNKIQKLNVLTHLNPDKLH